MEQIYTIPVNEAFDASVADPSLGCPFCRLFAKLEETEVDAVLGAAMMEPDIRIETNRQGFCKAHYAQMFRRSKMLPMALTMESRLAEISKLLAPPGIFSKGPDLAALLENEESCYVCGRISHNLSMMVATAVHLFCTDPDFPKKVSSSPFFCLPHYRMMLEYAGKKCDKKSFRNFYETVRVVNEKYLATLSEDVSWFCKKFDYRFDGEPWYNSKDSVKRSVAFLVGRDEND